MSHASWLTPIFDIKVMKRSARIIAKKINEDKELLGINCIAVVGVSGCAFGGLISYLTNLPLVVVRKGETRHSEYDVEYSDDLIALDYAFVDDLIDSGSTVEGVYEKLKHLDRPSHIMKIYLYRDKRTKYFPLGGVNIDCYTIPEK